MARLLNVDIPDNKKLEYSLPYIYGIGLPLSKRICEALDSRVKGIADKRVKDLSREELALVAQEIQTQGFLIEGDLRREIQGHFRRIEGIKCYRYERHRKGLPVRGQRTQTNARTRKGPRKTVGVQRNKDAKAGKV